MKPRLVPHSCFLTLERRRWECGKEKQSPVWLFSAPEMTSFRTCLCHCVHDEKSLHRRICNSECDFHPRALVSQLTSSTVISLRVFQPCTNTLEYSLHVNCNSLFKFVIALEPDALPLKLLRSTKHQRPA